MWDPEEPIKTHFKRIKECTTFSRMLMVQKASQTKLNSSDDGFNGEDTQVQATKLRLKKQVFKNKWQQPPKNTKEIPHLKTCVSPGVGCKIVQL